MNNGSDGHLGRKASESHAWERPCPA